MPDTPLKATFPKAEHLCLKRDIDALFETPMGTATAWPLRCLWRQVDEAEDETKSLPTQVLISVAKRHLHHAVDRNRAKRQIREAYRLQKALLPQGRRLHIAFVWLADQPQQSRRVHSAVGRLLEKINCP